MSSQEILIDVIKPSKYNPRSIKTAEYRALLEAVRKFGQVENLILNKDMTLISGHMRYRAMKELGFETVHCVVLDIDEVTEQQLNLTMNNPAISGEFIADKLGVILKDIKALDDDSYQQFRFDELEPVLGNDKKYDPSVLSSEEDYEAKDERQLSLIYTQGEYEELTHKTERLNEYDFEAYPYGHRALFLKLVEGEYERRKAADNTN